MNDYVDSQYARTRIELPPWPELVGPLEVETCVIGGGLAAAAGVFYGLSNQINPVLGRDLVLPIFAATIVGGVGSIVIIIININNKNHNNHNNNRCIVSSIVMNFSSCFNRLRVLVIKTKSLVIHWMMIIYSLML